MIEYGYDSADCDHSNNRSDTNAIYLPAAQQANNHGSNDARDIYAILRESNTLVDEIRNRLYDSIAGFGTIRIFRDSAAPMPVNISASASTASLMPSAAATLLPSVCTFGINFENRFRNLVNTRLNGSYRTSIKRIIRLSAFFAFCNASSCAFFCSLRRMHSRTISITTNAEYSANVVFPKLYPVSSDAAYAMEMIGDTPNPAFVFSVNPNARIISPSMYIHILHRFSFVFILFRLYIVFYIILHLNSKK